MKMETKKSIESEVSGYISAFLRRHFGKGPTSVYVTINRPFFTVHLRGFLSPIEKALMKQEEIYRVLETRDLMMLDLRPEIVAGLKQITGLGIKELFFDWNLKNETGMITGIMDDSITDPDNWPEDVNREEFYAKVIEASQNAEKVPSQIDIHWLSARTIVIYRAGILIRIEKELIKNGLSEQLRLAKRPVERETLSEVNPEESLKRTISEVFLDWNFEKDISCMVLLLEPPKH